MRELAEKRSVIIKAPGLDWGGSYLVFTAEGAEEHRGRWEREIVETVMR